MLALLEVFWKRDGRVGAIQSRVGVPSNTAWPRDHPL